MCMICCKECNCDSLEPLYLVWEWVRVVKCYLVGVFYSNKDSLEESNSNIAPPLRIMVLMIGHSPFWMGHQSSSGRSWSCQEGSLEPLSGLRQSWGHHQIFSRS